MKKLTVKQERFAELRIAGETQSAAYRTAYRSKASDKVVAVEASRLVAKPAVAARIAELQAQAAQGAVWTLKSRLADLAAIARDPATSSSERIRAIEVYTKLAGDGAANKVDVNGAVGSGIILSVAWEKPEPLPPEPLSGPRADSTLGAGKPELGA
jgi:hypothetical protein